MNIKRFVLSHVLILIIVAFSFAQSGDEKIIAQRQLPTFEDLWNLPDTSYFVPPKDNSWVIKIISTGGIMGGTRLVSAANSDGNVLCGQKVFDEKLLLPVASVEKLSGLTARLELDKKGISNGLPLPPPPINLCNDCMRTSIVFTRRGKEKSTVENYGFTLDASDSKSNEIIRQIFKEMSDSIACR